MVESDIVLSVILPVFNEAECIASVLDELMAAVAGLAPHEIILVDDGSTDATPTLLAEFQRRHPKTVRLIRIRANAGQSAAFWLGIQAASGGQIVLMDADGQNDPADIAACVAGLREADVCCGYRQNRRDTFSRRAASRLANGFRRAVLKDPIIDTGCSLKAFRAPFLKPLQYWDGMHRFLPVLAAMRGARIAQLAVGHRGRLGGKSKYTNFGRLRRTILDLFGVRWLQQRSRKFEAFEAASDGSTD